MPLTLPTISPIQSQGLTLPQLSPEDLGGLTLPTLNQDEVNSAPTTTFGKVLDFLSRPLYASSKFFDTLATDSSKTFIDALGAAGSELINPQQRMTYSDVLKHLNPQFAQNHPFATHALGFVGDVFLDPTTYLSLGTGDALKIGGELIANAGKDVVEKAIGKVGKEVALSKLGKASFTSEIANVEKQFAPLLAKGEEFSKLTSKELNPFTKVVEDVVGGDKIAQYRVLAQIAQNPDFASKAIAGGGLKFFGKSIIPGKAFQAASDAIGLTKLGEMVKATQAYKSTVGQAADWFVRRYGFGDKYNNIVKGIEGRYGQLSSELSKITLKLKDMGPESAKNVGEFQQLLSDTVQDASKELGQGTSWLGNGTPMAPDKIPAFIDANAQRIVDRVKANSIYKNATVGGTEKADREFALATRMIKAHQDITHELVSRGLQGETLTNSIFPMIKNIKNNPENENDLYFRLAKQFYGEKNVEMDALVMHNQRWLEARRNMINQDFKEALDRHGIDLEQIKLTDPTLARRMADDIRFVGEGDYPTGMPHGARRLLGMVDRITGLFRTGATVARPAFSAKQFVQNTLQSFLTLGVKSLGAFDPTKAKDAISLLGLHGGMFAGDIDKAALIKTEQGVKDALAGKFWNPVSATYEAIDADTARLARVLNTKLRSDIGVPITYRELIQEFTDHNVLRKTSLGGTERSAADVLKEVRQQNKFKNALGLATDGQAMFASGMAKWTSWPAIIEDLSRSQLYLNARMIGHSAEDAIKLTDKALFDYSRGLSITERRVFRRLVPFYSFQRFLYPLIATTALHEPGRLVNLAKTAEFFGKSWNKLAGGEELTMDERKAIPGYLLDQPFEKFDPDKQAVFKIINSYNPLDIFGNIEEKNGKLDIHRTLQNVFLSQLSPFIKMPLELLADKNFFTNQAISREGNKRAGLVGDINPDKTIGNIAALVAANLNTNIPGAVYAPIAKILGDRSPQAIQDAVKKLTGWEEGVDARTGKRAVYINPYLSYVATNMFPALNTAIRLDKYHDQPLQKYLDLFAGIPTQKINLKASARNDIRYQQGSIRDELQRIKEDLMLGRPDDADKAREELQALIDAMTQKYSGFDINNVRGQ